MITTAEPKTLTPMTQQRMEGELLKQFDLDIGLVKTLIIQAKKDYTVWQQWCERIKAKDVQTLESWRAIDERYKERIRVFEETIDLLQDIKNEIPA